MYQCPRIFTVIRSRLVNATIRFNEAFKKISQDVEFDTRRGHTWNSFPQALTRSSVSIADNYDESDGHEKSEKERVSVRRIISSVLRSASTSSSKDK